jgi:hypothetical protein
MWGVAARDEAEDCLRRILERGVRGRKAEIWKAESRNLADWRLLRDRSARQGDVRHARKILRVRDGFFLVEARFY